MAEAAEDWQRNADELELVEKCRLPCIGPLTVAEVRLMTLTKYSAGIRYLLSRVHGVQILLGGSWIYTVNRLCLRMWNAGL